MNQSLVVVVLITALAEVCAKNAGFLGCSVTLREGGNVWLQD